MMMIIIIIITRLHKLLISILHILQTLPRMYQPLGWKRHQCSSFRGNGLAKQHQTTDTYFKLHKNPTSILMYTRSQAVVCVRSLAGIAGSNSDGRHGCVSYECCVLSGRGTRRADQLSGGVLSGVVCLSVI